MPVDDRQRGLAHVAVRVRIIAAAEQHRRRPRGTVRIIGPQVVELANPGHLGLVRHCNLQRVADRRSTGYLGKGSQRTIFDACQINNVLEAAPGLARGIKGPPVVNVLRVDAGAVGRCTVHIEDTAGMA